MAENRHLPQKSRALKEHRKKKMEKLLLQPRHTKKFIESGSSKTPISSDKKLNIGSQIEGSYTVGGSVSCWNFITFGSSKPVYYGVKRE
ncbi:LOW QUALITY PROTEIN: hypothetical protein TorRG33x02_132610 [Trema orientale]|uniref:Uncharacterized protein n=1 Tax=Trema orientale TaxID=63057 RepID=A0A2P5EZ93_TREOI|nr:LOW QUALITY PROTEIN: hypothetical protein TorRG33x02_132610 [Trema orientale]